VVAPASRSRAPLANTAALPADQRDAIRGTNALALFRI
jgi:hypothetical protein